MHLHTSVVFEQQHMLQSSVKSTCSNSDSGADLGSLRKGCMKQTLDWMASCK